MGEHPRIGAEAYAQSLASQGIRVSTIRLAPFVYGRGGSFFAPMLMKFAAEHGSAFYVEPGTNCTSSADVDAAADLFLLALKKAPAGSVYNCTTETDVQFRAMAEEIGKAVDVPVKGLSHAEAEKICGPFITMSIEMPNRASSQKAQKQLGWQPQVKRKLLDDMVNGSYRSYAESLKAQFKKK
jgi:nucleoside-diphosphate-sugar epimerase